MIKVFGIPAAVSGSDKARKDSCRHRQQSLSTAKIFRFTIHGDMQTLPHQCARRFRLQSFRHRVLSGVQRIQPVVLAKPSPTLDDLRWSKIDLAQHSRFDRL